MRRFFIERIAHDVAYLSAVYAADHNPDPPKDRDELLERAFDLVMSGIVAYVDLVEQETPQVEFSLN